MKPLVCGNAVDLVDIGTLGISTGFPVMFVRVLRIAATPSQPSRHWKI
jgi:hypothetical protein